MPEQSSTNKNALLPSPPPVILCTGIAVLDFIFQVERFPTASTKAPTQQFVITGGGCAANAAIAIVRLGGQARFCGPLGDDETSCRIVQGLVDEGVNTDDVVWISGATASVSGVFIDPAGERLLTTLREQGLAEARIANPADLVRRVDAVLADNHFAEFVLPICQAAACRGIHVVLDVDRPTEPSDPLFACASHTIFSAEALKLTTGILQWERALARAAEFCPGFVAVTNGAEGVLWREGNDVMQIHAFPVQAVDTLAAGDVFHAALALALAEGSDETTALRFANAAAALKCKRFGGIIGSPTRAEVEHLLTSAVKNNADDGS